MQFDLAALVSNLQTWGAGEEAARRPPARARGRLPAGSCAHAVTSLGAVDRTASGCPSRWASPLLTFCSS